MRPLTRRQEEVLSFIAGFIKHNKYPPTIREISDNFSISVKGAYDHVKALEKKGVIRCDTNRSRAIEILDGDLDDGDAPPTTQMIPVLGNVAAGAPLLAEENFEGTVAVPAEYVAAANHFALNVHGDSMTGAGIMNGDLAIIRQQPTAENGDIVVAMVDDAVTLKRFFRESSRVQLKAENPEYPPIYTREVRILGKLVHLMRSYE
jgi:repressor LexA